MSLFEKLRGWRTPARPESGSVDGSWAGGERRGKARVNARAGTRVLVVDDSATIVALLRKMLRQNGYEVIEAVDVASALARVAGNEPELIFLDIVLPDGDGFQVLRACGEARFAVTVCSPGRASTAPIANTPAATSSRG